MNMVKDSNIEWTGLTLNFWRGCKMKGIECLNCYMHRWYKRRPAHENPDIPIRTGKAVWDKAYKAQAEVDSGLRTDRGRLVFTNSLADFFDPVVPDEWREDAWKVILETPGLVWQILTKVPQNIIPTLPPYWDELRERVWLGVTVGHPKSIFRLRHLAEAKKFSGATCFVSAEPLLEAVDFYPWLRDPIDWLIIGGESGPSLGEVPIRPMIKRHADYGISVCETQGVPVHFKQWGDYIDLREAQRQGLVVGTPDPKRMHENGESYYLGKKKAGRQINGRFHDDMPALPAYEVSIA